MNIVYYKFYLSSILTKLDHFLLKIPLLMILRKNAQTLPSTLSKVFENLTVFKKQEQAPQFPVRQIGQRILNIFVVAM